MTRLFYRCPIAAAWMAKNFGVQLEDKLGQPITLDELLVDMACNVESPWPQYAYVQADSLPIFEPQKGDLIKWRCRKAVDKAWRYGIIDGNPLHPDNEGFPIQRQGKAFIMPEVEA